MTATRPKARRDRSADVAQLREQLGALVLAHFARHALPGDRLAVYTRTGFTPRCVLLGPTRPYQEPPPNFGASAEWRTSAWKFAGILELPIVAPSPAMTEALAAADEPLEPHPFDTEDPCA